MKITGSTKKRAALCCAAIMSFPIMLGLQADENVQPAEVVEEPFAETVEENSDDTAVEKIDENKTDTEETEKVEEISEEKTKELDAEDIEDDEDTEDTDDAEDTNDNEETKPEENNPPEGVEIDAPLTQSEILVRDYIQQFEGRTIIDIAFEGASKETMQVFRNAIMAHVGDEFSTEVALRDRRVLKDSGIFYEAYQTFKEVPEGVIITWHVMENPVLKDVEFSGNTVFSDDELKKLITIKHGAIIDQNILHDNLAAIQEKYRAAGYVYARIINPSPTLDKSGILSLKINEGILEDYKLKGNTRTKDYVILREMRQKPGTPFNVKSMNRSVERLYNLGFFENVNVKPLPGVEPNAVVLEIEVKERRTGTFAIGAGYSTKEGLLGMISLSDTNFFGTGDSIGLAFETSADENDAHGYRFSYKKPWLDQKETTGAFQLYNRTYQYYDYDTHGDLKERYMRKYSGGEFTFSRPFSEYSTNYVTIRQRKDAYVRHVVDGNAGNRSTDTEWLTDNFGTTRSIGFQHVTDTRDNIYNPTKGNRVALGAEFSGMLGGDFSYQKYNIDHQHFLKAGHAQVWAFKAEYGFGEGDMTEFNQFRVGGQNSLRGYRDDQFRGSRMTLATVEYRFPLAKIVQGIVFTDWGGAWNSGFFPKADDFYGSVGVGMALNTPLGPLRLDYGRGKQGGRIHFSVGGGF